MTVMLIVCYLAAIVVANAAVAILGSGAIILTSAALIPFDLTAKDALQERWSGSGVTLRMAALILAGSLLSAILAPSTERIAAASFLAFALSGIVDALIFARMAGRGRLARINVSNLAGAGVDSAVFQALAFGSVEADLFVLQTAAKLAGGFIWSLILTRTIWRQR